MENNNITEEYITKMEKNRKIRAELFQKLRSCHNKLIIRGESIKSIIQYTAIYAAFSAINVGISVMELNSVAPIILGGLTIGYGIAIFDDVVTIIKNKPDEIYKKIAEYNGKLSDLDNEYMDYSYEIEAKNKLNSKNALYFDAKHIENMKNAVKKDEELTLTHIQNEKRKVKKYSKK